MQLGRFILPAILVVLAALPVALSRGGDHVDAAHRVIIYTPHNEQIRFEFGRAFAAWHKRTFGDTAEVVWNTPGGASDIRRILEANADAALREGRPIGGNADIVFGGGTYEMEQLKVEYSVDGGVGEKRSGRILAKPAVDTTWLAETYGDNAIGGEPIYDPDGYWIGVAFSGFGIVYNRDVLQQLAMPEPTEWADLSDARFAGALTLVNPAQSASVTTAFEAIIQRLGWERT